ncbi:MAG: hypothetical protein D3921_12865 [Candidatus Electrothrix sp. AW1]|nr:hypothetical protein [Candidatus Electrothrix sp. AX1]MCI5183382.1 hypothetical protein [Candidatus Electrothrix gigas]
MALIGDDLDAHFHFSAFFGPYETFGSVYVFTRAANGSWSQQDTLTPKDIVAGRSFGISLSLSADGNIALIGANCAGLGSVYVFTRAADGSWTQWNKLTAAYTINFGHSVSLSADGSMALIGAFDADSVYGTHVFVFTRAAYGGWSQQDMLDGIEGDQLGHSVSLSADGGIALIGSSVGSSGSYVFTRSADGSWPPLPVCGWGRNLPANTWLMTAPSCQPASPPGVGIAAQYGDDLSPDYATNWIGWKWDAAAQNYPPAMADDDPLVLGEGNWMYSRTAGTLNLEGTATPTTDCSAYSDSCVLCFCFDIDLTIPPTGQNRWNIVGHPFRYPVNWADVQVAVSSDGGATWTAYAPSAAESAGYVSKIYYRWNGNAYESYDDSTPGSLGVLQPQESVWVRSLGSYSGPVPQKLKLLIPVRWWW